jgi:uncharacterized membrane protein YkvA (DUF1232 family)
MFTRLKLFSRQVKRELKVYGLVLKDPRTPRLPKFLLWITLGYALLPFDVIPDFIPVLGYLDDVIIIPGLIFIALKLIPKEVIEDCRIQVKNVEDNKGEYNPD